MDHMSSSKNFDSIHDAYSFFMEHSTEAEQDLKSHLPYLSPLVQSGKTIRLLDFGCGDGLFSSRLLSRAGVDPHRLTLSLVEPDVGYLHQAATRLQTFSSTPVSAWTSLPSEQSHSFDLIVANHVLYYVNDLDQTLGQILNTLTVGGLFLISMGGSKNVLCHLINLAFASFDEPMPYYLAEDLEIVLGGRGLEFQRHEVNFELIFPDLEENRHKMCRFLLGEHFFRMNREEVLKLFDPYASAGRIVIRTCDCHFIIQK
jgi:trans-aconitate 2-methyltransferase